MSGGSPSRHRTPQVSRPGQEACASRLPSPWPWAGHFTPSAGWPGALGAAALVVAPLLPMLSRDGAVLGLLGCAVSFQLKVIIRKDCFPIIDL